MSVEDRRPPAFLAALAALGPALHGAGYELAVEHHDHAFGASWAEYRRRGGRLRLAWHGGTGALRAETAPATLDHWTEVAPAVGETGGARVERLAAVIARL